MAISTDDPSKFIFDTVLDTISNGIIPDIKTALIAVVLIALIYVGFDLVMYSILGNSISDELEYRQMKQKRLKREAFERRYNSDTNSHMPMGPAPDRK